MRVLIAPDKFKGTLSAREVAEEISNGIVAGGRSDIDCAILPLADGGDGSVEAAVASGYDSVPLVVSGPTGAPLSTFIAYDGHIAVIEVATIAGMSVLPDGRLDALGATSRGVGEAMRFAVEELGARKLVVGLGGSACTDGGAGLLHALGARFLNVHGQEVVPRAGELAALGAIDLSGVNRFAGIEVVGASDVRNPLLGPDGAARVFGPQKGADPQDVETLERALTRLSELTGDARNQHAAPGSGGAGGIGFAILLLGGALVSGADFFLDLLDFDTKVAGADLVVTGEGSLDDQTLGGKLVSVVAARAGQIPVYAVVGRSVLPEATARALGLDAVFAVADRTSRDTSRDAGASAVIVRDIGREIAVRMPVSTTVITMPGL